MRDARCREAALKMLHMSQSVSVDGEQNNEEVQGMVLNSSMLSYGEASILKLKTGRRGLSPRGGRA